MGLGFTSYSVDNDKKFDRAINRALSAVNDLSVPLNDIANDFFISRKAIFKLNGPGAYPDFKNARSERQKVKAVGFDYPLLKRSGRLEASITVRGNVDNVAKIGEKSAELGTDVPYGKFHQEGTRNLPQRKFLFIGPEGPKFASSDLSGFPKRALLTLNTFVLEAMGESIKGATGVDPVIDAKSADVEQVSASDIKR